MTEQFCTFELDDMLLGFEARRVHEVLRPQVITEVPLAPEAVRGLMNIRGQIVLVIDLRVRLGLDPSSVSRPVNVLVKTSHGLVSFLVDRIGEVLELDAAELEPVPSTLTGTARELLRGAAKLPSRLMLHLDPDRASLI